MRLGLHGLIEGDQLLACYRIAVFVFDQHAANVTDLDHVHQVGIERRAVEFDDYHLSQFLVQRHVLHKRGGKLALRKGGWRRVGHGSKIRNGNGWGC